MVELEVLPGTMVAVADPGRSEPLTASQLLPPAFSSPHPVFFLFESASHRSVSFS
jgi:hypothetical protein